MTISDLMKPFTIVIDWLRTYPLNIGEFTITFWDLFVWTMFASILIGFIVRIKNG